MTVGGGQDSALICSLCPTARHFVYMELVRSAKMRNRRSSSPCRVNPSLAPGETGELTVTFDDESGWVVCLIPGHYEAGMRMEVVNQK